MTKMEIDSVAVHYKGLAGEQYSKGGGQDVLNHLGHKLQARFFLPYLNKDMHVLDLGCGNGWLAKYIESNVASIEGLEVNEYPRKLAINQQLRVYDSLDSLPNTKKYDAIISNHVLEHIPNVIDTLKVVKAHLSTGGVLIVMLPIDDFREKTNREWRDDDRDHHLHTWTPLLFGNTLTEAGFVPKVLKVITYVWVPQLFFLGDNMIQSVAGYLLSLYLKRRQLLAVAVQDES